MCKYQFPEHSMIIKSADFVEKLKEVETLQQENKQLKEALNEIRRWCTDNQHSYGSIGIKVLIENILKEGE